MYRLIQSLVIIPENLIILMLPYGCLNVRKNKFGGYIFPMLLYTVWGNIAIFLPVSLARTVIGALIITLAIFVGFSDRASLKLWICLLIMVNTMLAEFCSLIFAVVGFERSAEFFYNNATVSLENLLTMGINFIVLLIINALDIYVWNRNNIKWKFKISGNIILMMLLQIIEMGCAFIVVKRYEIRSSFIGILFVLFMFFCTVMDVLLLNILMQTSYRNLMEYRLKLFEEQINAEFIYYRNVQENIQEIRKIKHDFYNQIQVIKLLLQEDDHAAHQMADSLKKRLECVDIKEMHSVKAEGE